MRSLKTKELDKVAGGCSCCMRIDGTVHCNPAKSGWTKDDCKKFAESEDVTYVSSDCPDSNISPGLIAGIVIGSIVIVGCAVATGVFFYKRKKTSEYTQI